MRRLPLSLEESSASPAAPSSRISAASTRSAADLPPGTSTYLVPAIEVEGVNTTSFDHQSSLESQD
jgi:hypothetical protein